MGFLYNGSYATDSMSEGQYQIASHEDFGAERPIRSHSEGLTFEVEVNEPPYPTEGKRFINFTAECSMQESGVVRIPAHYYLGCRPHPTRRNRWLARATFNFEWLKRSQQEHVRRAARGTLLTLADDLS